MAVTNVPVPSGSVKLFDAAIKLLKDWGWGPFLDIRKDWQKRSNGHKQPQVQTSIMFHHTGGTATSTEYLLNPGDRANLRLLANIHVDQIDQRIRILAAGPSSHAGNGTKANYDRMRAGNAPAAGDMSPVRPDSTWSANRYSVGVEVDGAGGKSEWNTWTKNAVIAVATAFNIAGKWAADGKMPRIWAHKEHTYRKPGDPYMNMGELRTLVKSLIASGTPVTPAEKTPTPEVPVLGKRVLSKNGIDKGADVRELGALLTAKGYDVGVPLDVFGPAMEKAVKAEQTKLGIEPTGIVDTITAAAFKGESVPQPQPEPEEPEEPEAPDPEPPVTPPTPAPTKRDFRMLQMNTLNKERFPNSQGVANNSTKWPEWLAKQTPSVMLLQETAEVRRDTIKKHSYFKNWKSWAVGMVVVFWDTKKWTHTGTAQYDYGNNIHGASRVTLKDNVTGLEADFISVHLPPNAAFPSSWSADRKTQGKRDVLDAILKKLVRDGVATFVGGDFNTATHATVMKKYGFVRLTDEVDTVDESGDQKLDANWHKTGEKVKTRKRGASLLNPGALSDHKGFLVNGTIELPTSTL